MAFSIGQVLQERKASHRITKPLKLEIVYQAKVISPPISAANVPQSSDLYVEILHLFFGAVHSILPSFILILSLNFRRSIGSLQSRTWKL